MFELIGWIVFGLIVGALAKLIMPGKDPGGIVVTAILGMVGSLLGTFIGRALFSGPHYRAGWIMSILGTILILAIYRMIVARRTA
ncbi:MAG TPA: GlsB/YeaQ/YmgE family stress response membrane protein [Blastocatellia bacterium]|nr:GlsB/YeaQ/YmgE family stress response membrane protein [Blastocatellia bacterium]